MITYQKASWMAERICRDWCLEPIAPTLTDVTSAIVREQSYDAGNAVARDVYLRFRRLLHSTGTTE